MAEGRSVEGPSEVVFAAGRGIRLLPITSRVPKALVPVLDVPLIELALRRGSSVGWANRFVNVSHLASAITEHLSPRPEVRVFEEGGEPLGTAATLRCLLPELRDLVVTYNCDLVSDLSLEAMIDAHSRGGKPCTLAVRSVIHNADIAVEGGRMHMLDRRRGSDAGFMYLGAACFDKPLLDTIDHRTPLGLVAGLLREAVEQQLVNLFEHPGYARDAGTLKGYLEASLEALDPNVIVMDPPGELSPALWYVGPGARVHPESLGRGAIVLANAQVERSTTLRDSIVWPGSRVPGGLELRRGVWFERDWLPVA